MKGRTMSCAVFPRLLVTAACLGIAGCATVPTENRARITDMPLASAHADIGFTLTTAQRRGMACAETSICPNAAESEAALRFARQVHRVAEVLQAGARQLYPDLAQRVPRMVAGQFDVYVVDGDDAGSASSANGRIAVNAGLGARLPYDDWMAFVIAREMGHVIARHHEENSSAGMVTSVIMNILIPGSGLMKGLVSAGGSKIASGSQRDVQTLEADAIALELLKAAGFRLRDIYLTLLIEPLALDDGAWSKSFKDSSDHLLAKFRTMEFAFTAVR